MSTQEWLEYCTKKFRSIDSVHFQVAATNSLGVLATSSATLPKAEMVRPPRPDTLEGMCRSGAAELGCDLTNEVYAARLKR